MTSEQLRAITSFVPTRKIWSFLDRDKHVAQFEQAILPGGRALVLCGGRGVGKSALLERFEQAASAQGATVALTPFTDTDPVDAIALMFDIAERISSATFQSYRELASGEPDIRLDIAVSGTTQSVAVANHASFRHVTMRDVIGQINEINNTVILDQEAGVSRRQQTLIKLTRQFLECLKNTAQQQRVVLLLDGIDWPESEAPKQSESSKWVERELLRALARGHLAGVSIVLACEAEKPALDDQLRSVSDIRYLEPLSEKHIIEYVAMRVPDMDPGPAEGYAKLALSHYRGNLKALGAALDSWILYDRRTRTPAP